MTLKAMTSAREEGLRWVNALQLFVNMVQEVAEIDMSMSLL